MHCRKRRRCTFSTSLPIHSDDYHYCCCEYHYTTVNIISIVALIVSALASTVCTFTLSDDNNAPFLMVGLGYSLEFTIVTGLWLPVYLKIQAAFTAYCPRMLLELMRESWTLPTIYPGMRPESRKYLQGRSVTMGMQDHSATTLQLLFCYT